MAFWKLSSSGGPRRGNPGYGQTSSFWASSGLRLLALTAQASDNVDRSHASQSLVVALKSRMVPYLNIQQRPYPRGGDMDVIEAMNAASRRLNKRV